MKVSVFSKNEMPIVLAMAMLLLYITTSIIPVVLPSYFRYAYLILIIVMSLVGAFDGLPVNKAPLLLVIISFYIMLYFGKWQLTRTFIDYFKYSILFFVPIFLTFGINKVSIEKTKKLLDLFVILVFITLITTIIGVIVFPDAAREMARTDTEENVRHLYSIMNIGGYSFVYGNVIAAPLLIHYFNENRRSLVCFLYVILTLISLILAQYTIAIVLFALEFIVLIISNKKMRQIKLYRGAFIAGILICVFAFGKNILISVLEFVLGLMKNDRLLSIKERIYYVAYILKANVWTGDALKRKEVYDISFNAFKENPIFGAIVGKNAVGLHSEFLDILGGTGLVGMAIMCYLLYSLTKERRKFSKNILLYNATAVSLLGVICMGLVNAVFMSPLIGFSAVLLPELIYKIEEASNGQFEE